MTQELFLQHHLDKRQEQGLLRTLKVPSGTIDFCSNDYLGFARSEELKHKISSCSESACPVGRLLTPGPRLFNGSTGSRLLSGNSAYAEDLEKYIAQYHNAEAGLIFNSGYDANVGLLSSVAQRGDTIMYDEFIHASVRDGTRLSLAKAHSFMHNDLDDLEKKLKKKKGNVFVAVESVYSMDGDFSPLKEIVSLCQKHNANLIVDEAHATGLYGSKGEGRCVELGLEKVIFARVHTFGKALGTHGAIVLGSGALRNYLINFSRPFIYSTALPFHALLSIKCAYDILANSEHKALKIKLLKDYFKSLVKERFLPSQSSIQCMIIPGNEQVKNISEKIQTAGFDVRPILSPTVPKGKERIRICIHAFNTEEEVKTLTEAIQQSLKVLPTGAAQIK